MITANRRSASFALIVALVMVIVSAVPAFAGVRVRGSDYRVIKGTPVFAGVRVRGSDYRVIKSTPVFMAGVRVRGSDYRVIKIG